MTIFEGAAVALVLPMHEDGAIDYDGFRAHIRRMIEGGVKALLVNGTTGETATISIEDEFELIDITLEEAKGHDVKVISGAGSNDTATAIKKAKYCEEAGVDAILVVTPYYNKTSQEGLFQHFTAIANATELPMILYNVPGRTGVNMAINTVVRLAKNPKIVAIKDATDDIAYAMELMAATKDEDFDLYSGCDDNILPIMAAGAKGVISVLANVYPRECQMLCDYVTNCEMAQARALAYDLEPISRNLFIDVNPIMPKAALSAKGYMKPTLRLPLIETTPEKMATMVEAMKVFESKGY